MAHAHRGLTAMSQPNIGGLLRTYARDADWLMYALRSISKFGFPLLSSMTLVFPEEDSALFESIAQTTFPWLRLRATSTDRIFRNRISMSGCDSGSCSLGFAAQIYDKLSADQFMPEGTDFIVFFDSDCILLRPWLMSDIMAPAAPGSKRPRPRVAYSSWQDKGLAARSTMRAATALALRVSPEHIRYSFLTHTGLCFPIGATKKVRETVARRHNSTDFLQYALDVFTGPGRRAKQFSEFELISSYYWLEEQSTLAFEPWYGGFPILQRWNWGGLDAPTRLMFECILSSNPEWDPQSRFWTNLGFTDNASITGPSESLCNITPLVHAGLKEPVATRSVAPGFETMHGCPDGWPLEIRSDGTSQLCRKRDGDRRGWRCAPFWRRLPGPPYCSQIERMEGCPDDWTLELQDDGYSQLCRKKDASADWRCAPGWEEVKGPPFCRPRGLRTAPAMANCPPGWPHEMLPNNRGQLCRRNDSSAAWVCAPFWLPIDRPPFCRRIDRMHGCPKGWPLTLAPDGFSQLCRKNDMSGAWKCARGFVSVDGPPNCKKILRMQGCPEDWPLEISASGSQMCKKSDNSKRWTCASGWTKLRTAPFCNMSTPPGMLLMSECPPGWPLEVRGHVQVCRKSDGSSLWRCARGWTEHDDEEAPTCLPPPVESVSPNSAARFDTHDIRPQINHEYPADWQDRLEIIRGLLLPYGSNGSSAASAAAVAGNIEAANAAADAAGRNASAAPALTSSDAESSSPTDDIAITKVGNQTFAAFPVKRVLFTYSFWLPKWAAVVKNVQGWDLRGPVCSGRFAPFTTLLMAPSSAALDAEANANELVKAKREVDAEINRRANGCFGARMWYTKSSFYGADAMYPLTPSVQFFQIMQDAALLQPFDVLWWMEPDIRPIRPFFVDELVREAASTPKSFWMRGSMTRGMPPFEREPITRTIRRGGVMVSETIPPVSNSSAPSKLSWLNDPMWLALNRDWIFHVNGAALYTLKDAAFAQVLRASKALTIRNPQLPFDVTICIVLMEACGMSGAVKPSLEAATAFSLSAEVATRVHYTNLIWNVGRQANRTDVIEAAKRSGAILLHGAWNDVSMRDGKRVLTS